MTKAGGVPTAPCRLSAPGSGGSTTHRLSRPATVPFRPLLSSSVWPANDLPLHAPTATPSQMEMLRVPGGVPVPEVSAEHLQGTRSQRL